MFQADLFGCRSPGFPPAATEAAAAAEGTVWECPQSRVLMNGPIEESDPPRYPVCGPTETARDIFLWTDKEPGIRKLPYRFELPPGIGFHVGGDSGVGGCC